MTDSIQIHRKKASFILAVSVTSYSVIATYLYNCHQINLMEYTTPIILSIVLLTLSCAFSQRFFYRYRFFVKFGGKFFSAHLANSVSAYIFL